MAKPIEQIKVTFRLAAPLVRRAKHFAVDHDMNLQDVVGQALEAFLNGGRA